MTLNELRFRLELTGDELLLLDGLCRPENQCVVDGYKASVETASKTGLPPMMADMVTRILDTAKKTRKLVYRLVETSRCPCCDRHDGYWPVARSTKWKRRGDKDYDNPKKFCCVDLGGSCVRSTVFLGFCEVCRPLVEPVLASALESVECDTPKAWAAVRKRFVLHNDRLCTRCQWRGHEGQMRTMPCLMGGGTYPALCPQCGAGAGLFNREIKILDTSTLVRIEE